MFGIIIIFITIIIIIMFIICFVALCNRRFMRHESSSRPSEIVAKVIFWPR